MRYLKKFNEAKKLKERIKTSDFIEEVKKVDEEFTEECESETPKNAVSTYLLDTYFSMDKYYTWSKDKSFPYKLIDIQEEKGDGKDEETVTGIFQRKSDGKCFALWMRDDGFIGPETLTMCEWMEEVTPITKKIKKWK